MTKKFFPRAYGLTEQADIDAFYDDWAQTYDKEVTENGYQSPRRCAQALAQFVALDQPIIDMGCGTGLSGLALAAEGFTNITGTEINPNMRAEAEKRKVYKEIRPADLNNPLPFKAGAFAAITAVGVISAGAGPATLLPAALNKLHSNGFLCLSYNDHTLETASYVTALDHALSTHQAELVFDAYGDHLSKLGVKSRVYVLRKI